MRAFSVWRQLLLLIVWGAHLGAGAAFFLYNQFDADLPRDLSRVLDYQPLRATRVYSADGELIGEFFLQKRVPIPLDRIPAHVQNAFISAEDRRFWRHKGFDPIGIARAGYANFRGGGVQQGASTITQQVTRMLLLSNERTLSRKAKELILSVRVERELSKREILYIYLNHVYLGHGAYGVQAAAEAYFGKDVSHLTVAEAALLAGLPKAPTKFSPYNDYHRARERQAYVLGRMREDGFIDPITEEKARREPMVLVGGDQPLAAVAAPYFVEHIRRWATAEYGERLVLGAGLSIYTTVDMRQQLAAEAAVRDGLVALDTRLGFRGPIGHLEGAEREAFVEGPPRPYVGGQPPGKQGLYAGGALLPGVAYVGVVVEIPRADLTLKQLEKRSIVVDLGPRDLKMDPADAARLLRWKDGKKRLTVGDLVPVAIKPAPPPPEKPGSAPDPRAAPPTDTLVLAEAPDVQAALVAIDPATGDVTAMVGGWDYGLSQFNRATQAKRQAGSSIKAFVYAAALEHGYHHLSIVPDAPIAVQTAGGLWTPGNYKNEFLGPLTLRTALAKSINTISVRLVLATGVDAVIDMMRALGITSPIPRHVSVALGTPDVSLLEMTAAYAAFPAGGKRVAPRFVRRVVTGDGDVLLETPDRLDPAAREQAVSPATAYLMTDLLRGVVKKGTGRKATALGRPAAGKTGTSTGFRDAWFIAFTADLAVGVWVGRDNFKPIGHDTTGGGTALPIWLQFMTSAHPRTPVRDFAPPPDILFVRADEKTGAPALPGQPGSVWVPFARGTLPPRFTGSVPAAEFTRSQGFAP